MLNLLAKVYYACFQPFKKILPNAHVQKLAADYHSQREQTKLQIEILL